MADYSVKNLASLLTKEIESFSRFHEESSVGTVISVGDGIARVYGLKQAMLGELLLFPNGATGMALNLDQDDIGVVLLENGDAIKEGDEVKATGRVVEVPVGDALLGRVVNALGKPIDGLGEIKSEKRRPIERVAPGVMKRESVNRPLFTGLKAIDSMIPIGRGQRELIIGDRQTGKTAIAIDAILSQKKSGVKCVYVAIGQKDSSVASLVHKLKEADSFSYVTVVNAGASEASPELYVAPFAGMAIAEEWMEKGEDVLIIFDDLSKHAVAYRALSLLLRRSPGREAYPGDIFYLHSRLLERACKLSKEYGGGSITALPIVETQAGDISSYIPTNIISITDGQIFLVTDYFNEGQRPAIDSGLSVSRVGSAAQTPAMKKVSASLKISLANYRENLSFAQFGSDLDKDTKRILTRGARAMEVLKQTNFQPYKESQEVVELLLLQEGKLDNLKVESLHEILSSFFAFLLDQHHQIIEHLEQEHTLPSEISEEITNSFDDFLARSEYA